MLIMAKPGIRKRGNPFKKQQKPLYTGQNQKSGMKIHLEWVTFYEPSYNQGKQFALQTTGG